MASSKWNDPDWLANNFDKVYESGLNPASLIGYAAQKKYDKQANQGIQGATKYSYSSTAANAAKKGFPAPAVNHPYSAHVTPARAQALNVAGYNKAVKANKKADVYTQLMQQQAADFKRAEQMHREGLQRIAEGYSAAQSQMGRGAGLAKQEISDLMQSEKAAMDQAMMNRGLGNTTVGLNAQRSVANDTSRRLAEVNAALAGGAGELAIQRGSAIAGANQALSGYYMNRDAMRSSLALDIKKMQMQEAMMRAQRRGLLGQALGGLIGNFAGALGGGYFGELGKSWVK